MKKVVVGMVLAFAGCFAIGVVRFVISVFKEEGIINTFRL